jgi:putative oxidoreductase
MNIAYTLGRILLPIVFIVAGVQKLMDVSGIARLLEASNVPVPDEVVPYLQGVPKYEALGYLVGGLETLGGLMVLIGLKARWGALMLIVFSACTIFFVHRFWDMEGEAAAMNQTQALMNLAIMGGLLLVVACGSGPASFDRRG